MIESKSYFTLENIKSIALNMRLLSELMMVTFVGLQVYIWRASMILLRLAFPLQTIHAKDFTSDLTLSLEFKAHLYLSPATFFFFMFFFASLQLDDKYWLHLNWKKVNFEKKVSLFGPFPSNKERPLSRKWTNVWRVADFFFFKQKRSRVIWEANKLQNILTKCFKQKFIKWNNEEWFYQFFFFFFKKRIISKTLNLKSESKMSTSINSKLLKRHTEKDLLGNKVKNHKILEELNKCILTSTISSHQHASHYL